MKITINNNTIEIPDELVNKIISVIDELLDRTYDDWEERSWTGVDFPLVPFPFFDKNRLPENVGIDDYWISYWLDTSLMNTIRERTKIIEILNKARTLKIEHHPIINEFAGIFDGDKFELSIERDKLTFLRKLIRENQQKLPTKKGNIIKSPIRKTALQNITSVMKELTTHSGLTDLFEDFNASEDISMGSSKYDRVFSVLSSVNQETLFKIIEEAVHPLRFFGGEEEIARQLEDTFSSFLQFDGYCIHNGKIVKSTPEILKKIKSRIEKRKKEETNQTTKNKEFIPIKEPLPIRIVGEVATRIKSSENKSFSTKGELIELKSQTIELDEDKAIIKIGKQNVALPPYKNEHYFCQVMFEYKPKEPVSWDIIYDRMTGHSTVSGGRKPEPIRENWQKVNDTMKRVNNRIKEIVNTDDNLFSWSEKTVMRNH